jgi:hypothetical protein
MLFFAAGALLLRASLSPRRDEPVYAQRLVDGGQELPAIDPEGARPEVPEDR